MVEQRLEVSQGNRFRSVAGRRRCRGSRRTCRCWCACRSRTSATSTTPSRTARIFACVAGDDKTPLKFHFEKYDPQNQMALLWVRVPQITGGSKTDKIYVYYGNPDAPRRPMSPAPTTSTRRWCCTSARPSGLPLDATAYKNNPSASTRGADAGLADRRRREVLAARKASRFRRPRRCGCCRTRALPPRRGCGSSRRSRAVVFALGDQGKSIELAHRRRQAGRSRRARRRRRSTVTQASDRCQLGQWHHVAADAPAPASSRYMSTASRRAARR